MFFAFPQPRVSNFFTCSRSIKKSSYMRKRGMHELTDIASEGLWLPQMTGGSIDRLFSFLHFWLFLEGLYVAESSI